MAQRAAIAAAVILVGVALFQLALALGAPWGSIAYGGRAPTVEGVLSTRYRVASAAAVVVLLSAAWILLARAGVVPSGPVGDGSLKWAVWVIFVLLLVNTVSNMASTNRTERWVFGPLTFIAAVLCLIVALRADASPPADTAPPPAAVP